MAKDEQPTINDFLARLYTIRDEAAERTREEARAIVAHSAAKSQLHSGGTLKALAELIEKEFDKALTEVLATLRHMKSVLGIDYEACWDQAFLRARDLIPVLRGASDLDKWIGTIGRGTAGDVINRRVDALFEKIPYRFRQFDVGLDQVVVMRSEHARAAIGTEPARAASSPAAPAREATSSPPFQVALSFAGEQRDYVRQVAENLKSKGIKVFYDGFEATDLWGKDGAEHFHHIYAQGSQYVVMFISADYVAKEWTRQERRAAISRQMKADTEYILPVRFDQSAVPGIPDTLQYLLADRYTPAALADAIATKIGATQTRIQPADFPAPLASAPLPPRSLIWRPAIIGAKAKMYMEVASDGVEKVVAAVRAVGGVQAVRIDQDDTTRPVIAIELPASAEAVQRSIASRVIKAAQEIDASITLVS